MVTSSQNWRSLFDATLPRITGDQRRIDAADRDACDPVRFELRFRERLVDARLIGTERTPALQ